MSSDGHDDEGPLVEDAASQYQLTVQAEGLSEDAAAAFNGLARGVHAAVWSIAGSWQCPPVHIEAVASTDFLADVQQALTDVGDEEAAGFSLERIGGVVAAKNVALAPDGSHVRIVFDAQLVCPSDDPLDQPVAINLLAHEMAHPLFGRLRLASGALDRVVFPSRTPIEMARSICRIAAEEFRADWIANAVLTAMVSWNPDGEAPRPMVQGELSGQSYKAQVADVLDAAIWPKLPRTVRRYQEYGMDLDNMWRSVVETTDQTFTLLAHAESEANSLDLAGPLEEAYGDHPGTRYLLRDAWLPFVAALHEQPVIPRLAEWHALESDLLAVGEAGLLGLWERLGITSTVQPSGEIRLFVKSPDNETEWIR